MSPNEYKNIKPHTGAQRNARTPRSLVSVKFYFTLSLQQGASRTARIFLFQLWKIVSLGYPFHFFFNALYTFFLTIFHSFSSLFSRDMFLMFPLGNFSSVSQTKCSFLRTWNSPVSFHFFPRCFLFFNYNSLIIRLHSDRGIPFFKSPRNFLFIVN